MSENETAEQREVLMAGLTELSKVGGMAVKMVVLLAFERVDYSVAGRVVWTAVPMAFATVD